MTFNVAAIRQKLQVFEFQDLFIELGWNNPAQRRPVAWQVAGRAVERREIANLAGVIVFEISSADGLIPDEPTRRAIYQDVVALHREHILIFLDRERSSSLWYWVKRNGGSTAPRRHTYVRGQPGDALIGKLSAMFVDMSELDAEGNLPLVEAARRVRQALDVEPVTRQFFSDFQAMHSALLAAISGIADERDRRWYASVLLNRLMFVYFLQRRGFLDNGDYSYLQHKLAASQSHGDDRFYPEFLQTLFFAGFATPEEQRDPAAQALIGRVRYLNGGLFLKHQIEQQHAAIAVPDAAFQQIFDLFAAYDWSLDDTAGGNQKEINPAVLGYIFEKYINQKAFGAYYTRTEITEYLCEQTIHRLVLDAVNAALPPNARPYDSVGDLLLKPTAQHLSMLLRRILPDLRLIDPACGSGAFLVAAMRTLIEIYSALFGKARFSSDAALSGWVAQIERQHPNIDYFIKKQIITNNLFGVDIMAEATEIARLRLFLALVASANRVEDLEPLPNIDFNVLPGNSLVGLLRVDAQRADASLRQRGKDGSEAEQLGLFAAEKRDSYRQLVAEKNRLIAAYRNAAEWNDETSAPGIQALRDEIQRHRAEAATLLDALLLDDFQALGIRYEQATWDAAPGKAGTPRRRPLTIDDIRALQPFHWGYEFDEVMNERGGFDAIITNPPWEVFKPNAKEFFADHSNVVTKKTMTIKEFEQEQTNLLQDSITRNGWLDYLSQFPYQSEYYRSAPQYRNQISVMNGKKAGTDINLYKLFTEQCYNMLRDGGQCGIIIPGGMYTDLGTKQLRETLFTATQLKSLLSMSNEKFLFEGVHHAFKFCLLVFEKGSVTDTFRAAFRINPREAIAPSQLDTFLNTETEHLPIQVALVRRLSPDSLSIMEFRSKTDIEIAEKMLCFPLLGEKHAGTWNLKLTAEFHMTNDSRLFRTAPAAGRLPLYEGKMIWQFDHHYSEPRYWVDESEGRAALIGRKSDTGQLLDYQAYRLGFRDIAANTNERSMIAAIIPPAFHGNKIPTARIYDDNGNRLLNDTTQLYLAAVWNSFVIDYLLRLKITNTLNFFYIYQLPVPRLMEQDAAFAPIVERAAKLICTTPEYDALASEVGLHSHAAGVTDAAARAQLRAELDAMVAHLYGLTEAELTHILGSFPLVAAAQKAAVLTEFRRRAPHPDDAQLAALIGAGESDSVEFKVAALWNPHSKAKDSSMRENVVQGVAAFLNSAEGGQLIIGVENGTNRVVGLADDYAAANPQKRDRDGYELWLRDVIGTSLGQPSGASYTITFHRIGNADVCRVSVRPAAAPVYYNGDLLVRIGNGKKKLSAKDALAYVAQRWRTS